MVETLSGKVETVVALNIKNEEAVRLAKELAALEGESMTTVVIEALREKLERDHKPRIDDAIVQKWLARGSEIRAHIEKIDPESLQRDPFEDLYGDKLGLPK